MPKIDFAKPPQSPLFSEQVVTARRFFLGESDRHRSTLVRGGGLEHVSRDYTVTRTHVPFVALELVVAGEGEATLDDATFPLLPGTFFTYGPRTRHRLVTSPRNRLTKYFLDLDGQRGRTLVVAACLPLGRVWPVHRWLDLARLYDEIIHVGMGGGPLRHEICDALARALLLQAAETTPPKPDMTLAFASYQRCCALIDTDFHRFRSLQQVADEAGLNVAYICRLFKRFDDHSPYQRLLRKRMTAAAAALYRSDLSVQQVARQFGYSDQFHFSRSFKTVLHISPNRFRTLWERQCNSEAVASD